MLGAQSPGVESVNSNVTGVTCETVQTLISGAMEAWKLEVDIALDGSEHTESFLPVGDIKAEHLCLL
ncbi:rCG41016 [Rattus norvegicus]|uniref:RCG41016 n=1 Tax=Rattus norvegicus TaxID=10116 RepID=A6K238_RAT|nr:rCG41016 [Rattus norvegicus]